MKLKELQWSDELRQEVGEALANSKLVEVMKKHGIFEKGTFEVQINLMDKDSEARTGEVSKASISSKTCFRIVYYEVCSQCEEDGGIPMAPPGTPSCLCRIC